MNKCVSYIRVSGKGQDLYGTGKERQKDKIYKFCNENDYDNIKTFYDTITGTKEYRKGLNECLDYMKENNISYLIIETLNRLSRELIIQESIIKGLEKNNIQLVSVKEGNIIDISIERKMIRQILGSVSEYQKDEIVEKLRYSREKIRKEKGKCEGRKGYNEVSIEVVRKIKELRRKKKGNPKRMSFSKICFEMNRLGYKTLSNKPFQKHHIQYILSNC